MDRSNSEKEEPSAKRMRKESNENSGNGNESQQMDMKYIAKEKEGDENSGNGNESQQMDMKNIAKEKEGDENSGKDLNRKDEEKNILKLFTFILDIIMITGAEGPWISKSASKLRESYKLGSCDEYDYSVFENRAVFLYRHGSHGAGLARYRILRAIQECGDVKSMLERKNLKIICLGTGPGNDAVGLCSALSELQFPDNLKLTVVDRFEEWSKCVGLAQLLIKTLDYGKVSELFKKTKVDLQFIKVNLPGNPEPESETESKLGSESTVELESKSVSGSELEPEKNPDKEYFQMLKEADVILMSKLISRQSNERVLLKAIQQSFLETIKDEALIINIDIFYARDWKDFERLYGFPYNYPYDDNREMTNYTSTALAEPRFGTTDAVTSELPINVLRKKGLQD